MYTQDVSPARVKPLYRGTQVVWYLLMIIEALLAFRFVLRLLGANPEATFSQLVYGLSQPFLAPFWAVFPSSRAEGVVFEWSTLLAMFVYWLLAWAIVKLFVMGKPVSTPEADRKLSDQEHM